MRQRGGVPSPVAMARNTAYTASRSARAYTAAAGRDPAEAERALERARAARAAVYVTFRALASGDPAPAGPLDRLRAGYVEALDRARMTEVFVFEWDGDDLDRVLWPLSIAAVDLLRFGPLDRLKMCAVCRWLFLDASRNHSRRWCSMNECGGRLKMKRYRARRAR